MFFYQINILYRNTKNFINCFIINTLRNRVLIVLLFNPLACSTALEPKTASMTPVSQAIRPLQLAEEPIQTAEQPMPTEQIELAQTNLDLLGYDIDEFSDELTPQTRAALADFQKKSGLPETGTLTPATLQGLEEAVQKKSKKTRPLHPPIPTPALNQPTVTQKPTPPPPTKTFTDIKTMGIYQVAAPLAALGYFHGLLQQATLDKVETALKKFQRDIGVDQTGLLDETTSKTLQRIKLNRARKAELEAVLALSETQPLHNNSGIVDSQLEKQGIVITDNKKPVELPPPSSPISGRPGTKDSDSRKQRSTLKIHDSVYAIDKIECKGDHEAFILYYQGELENILENKVQIRITKRYALWYDSHKSGISDTDWWCIPKKRFCYSMINFTDWRGKLKFNDLGEFDKKLTVQSDAQITTLIAKSSKQACSF
jgi:peptidoglycan hydrolase-like protein with peptidoglycan-binding domain